MKNTIEEILNAMSLYGGTFVQKLAHLFRSADFVNQGLIKKTWPDIFQQYDEMATVIKLRNNRSIV